jgi:hypothetical protein
MDELESFASLRPEVMPLTDAERAAIRSRSFSGTAGGMGLQGAHDAGRGGAGRIVTRRRVLVTAVTLTLLVGTGALVKAARSGHVGAGDVDVAQVEDSSPSDIDDEMPRATAADIPMFLSRAQLAGASGYCGFTPDQLAGAPWALDGEVLSITTEGPGVWGSASSVMVHLMVNSWFRGDGAEVDIVIPIGGEPGMSLQHLHAGERVLLAGELRDDGSLLAWACGFVIPWSPEENAVWVGVFR